MITKRLLFSFLLGCTVAVSQNIQAHTVNGMSLPATQKQQLHFTENKGQITDQFGAHRSDIQFRIAGQGVNVFIGDGQMHYQWSKRNMQVGSERPSVETYRMDVTLVGANRQAKVLVEEKQSYTEHYYLASTGNEGAIASTYNKVTYKNVYPSIDWVLYVKDNKLEYDFVVHPGGKVSDIKLQYAGTTSLGVNGGTIIATTPMGMVKNNAPYSFMQANGQKVNSQYVLNNNMVSFGTGSYTGTLIIDPVVDWGTYLGGTDGEYASDVLVDVYGAIYITGYTASTANIATTGSHQTTYGGGFTDFYLSKFNKYGMLMRSTYYGGTDAEMGAYIVSDKSGNVYLSGQTTSTAGIATPGSHQDVMAGQTDGFLVKFDSAGTRQWATYYGGAENEVQNSLTIDSADNVYICGQTTSLAGISSPNAFQVAKSGAGSADNAYIAKFNGAGTRIWATYLGGNTTVRGLSIHADKHNAIYLCGTTSAVSGLATPGAHQTTRASSPDDFLAKFDSSGIRIWCTYHGGTGIDNRNSGRLLASDDSGNIYMVGYTESVDNIATPGAHQTAKVAPGRDCYVVKFDSGGVKKWGTYYGGTGVDDMPFATVCDKEGNVYVAGVTSSPTVMATPGSYQDVLGGTSDGFIAKFDRLGNRSWATYFGGAANDGILSLVFDHQGDIYTTGISENATGIATPGTWQTTHNGMGDAFLVKFCSFAAKPDAVTGVDSICENTTHTYTVQDDPNKSYIWELPQGWTGTSTTNTITATGTTTGGTISVKIIKCDDTSDAATFNVYVRPVVPAVIVVNGFVLSTSSTHSSYQWYKDGQLIPGATNPTFNVTQNGVYTVKVTNPGGCTDSSDAKSITNISVPSVYNIAKEIFIYPNPASNVIYIDAPAPVGVSISGVDGKTVIYQTVAKDVDISGLAQGIYLVRIISEDGKVIKVEKLIKTAQ